MLFLWCSYPRGHKCQAKGKQSSKCKKMNLQNLQEQGSKLETRSKSEDEMEFMIETISSEEKVE